VNNLPKVVMQHHLEQDLNRRPTDRKPKCLTRCTTTPPIHRYWPTIRKSTILVRVRVRVSIVLRLVRLGSRVMVSRVRLRVQTFRTAHVRNSGPFE